MIKKDKNTAANVPSPVGDTKNKAKGFVNWTTKMKDGTELKSDKGFPIFQNPDFPNPKEDLLLALADKHGGTVTITMEATIRLNGGSPEEVNLDDFLVA